MTDIEKPYSVHLFNQLPGIEESHTTFESKNGLDFINSVIKPMIAKYSLEEVLGVTLLHNHFDLREGERMVEVNNISVPWGPSADDELMGGSIRPAAWLIDEDGKLMPYEFSFSAVEPKIATDLNSNNVKSFAKDFVEAVKAEKLEKVVGIRVFPYPGFQGGLEFTKGRANIVLSPGQVRFHLPHLHEPALSDVYF